jgi:ketosteroid isomerase-like protein
MHKILLVTLATAVLALPAPASDQSDVMAAVNRFVSAFNKGDSTAAVAECAEQAAIIDEFAPYVWHGDGACGAWLAAWAADAQQKGITDAIVTLGKPMHVDVNGDRAYVVAPANYVWKQKGKPMKETNSILALSLLKGAAGWKLTGWSWAKH